MPEYNIITGRRNNVFPSRADTMYLSKISNRHKRPVQERKTNRTDDIDMAQPQRWSEMYTRNMPDLHGVGDIEGAQPAKLHRGKAGATNRLSNEDIPGTTAKPYTFKTTRCVDPNDPAYKLPTVDTRPPTPPRFSRDSINVQDIDGAWPKPMRHFEPRDSHGTSDIEGAQAGWKPRHKRRSNQNAPLRNTLSVDDIVKEGFRTTRIVDPLNPQHRIHGRVHEDGPKQRPRGPPVPCGQDFSLHTEDIAGAYPGWKAPHHIDGSFTKNKGRRHYRKINATTDIPGANADSKHNYIVTKRVTNPLKPEYRGLDGYPYDLSPPTTPAHDINRPPPQVREKTDKNLAMRNAQDDLAKTKLLERTGRANAYESVGAEPSTAGGPPSESLKLNLGNNSNLAEAKVNGSGNSDIAGRPPRDPRDDEIQRLRRELELARAQSMGGGRGSLSSGRRSSRGSSRGNSARGNTLAQAGGQAISSSGGGVDRMVLLSRDGRPRVATPSQIQMAQKRQDTARKNDLNAVSNLPSY